MRQRTALLAWLALAAAAPPAAAATPDAWLKAEVLVDRTAVARGDAFRMAVVLEIDRGYHINANPQAEEFPIPTVVRPEPHPAVTWGNVAYPAGERLSATWAESGGISVYQGKAVIVLEATAANDAPTGPTILRLHLSYQGCDADTCYPPNSMVLEKTVTIVEAGTATDKAHADVFAAAAKAAPVGGLPAFRFEGEADVASWYEQGFPAYLGLLFLGGLALNLLPCVFPLIPVTMNVFAQQGEKRPLKVLPLALVYALGLAATFTAVGVLAALAGKSLGLVLQSPWGVLGVVTVMAAMMASTFGAFEIQLPSGAMGKLGARRGLLGAGFMGMVMGAIAAPCVGPILIALIAFIAMKRSVLLGGVSFFVTGLGMSLPYVFLGTFTSLINRFPRGGAWLIWVKRLLGLALAGLILYFIQPYVAPAFFWPAVLGLFVFAAVFLGLLEGQSRRPFTKRFWAVRITVAALLLAGGIAFYARYAPAGGQPAATPAAASDGPHVEWTPWQEGALRNAADAGEPALLYFGATWCIECRTWKAHIFTNPDVVEASKGLARIYVDMSQAPEGAKRRFSDTYRGTNPPAVIVFGRDGRVVTAYRNPPSPKAFLQTLKRAAPEM